MNCRFIIIFVVIIIILLTILNLKVCYFFSREIKVVCKLVGFSPIQMMYLYTPQSQGHQNLWAFNVNIYISKTKKLYTITARSGAANRWIKVQSFSYSIGLFLQRGLADGFYRLNRDYLIKKLAKLCTHGGHNLSMHNGYYE